MRIALLALSLLLTAPALAQIAQPSDQVIYNEGVAALVPVDAFARPGDVGVWTDMRPQPFKGSDEEFQAATGATLYAGPAPGTLSIEAWHERVAASGPVDCSAATTVCAARVEGRGDRESLVFPFGAAALRLPEGTRMRVVPRLRLSDAQASALREARSWDRSLVLGDGNTLVSPSDATALMTTHPDALGCGLPGVRCGVVFEVEVTAAETGLSVVLF